MRVSAWRHTWISSTVIQWKRARGFSTARGCRNTRESECRERRRAQAAHSSNGPYAIGALAYACPLGWDRLSAPHHEARIPTLGGAMACSLVAASGHGLCAPPGGTDAIAEWRPSTCDTAQSAGRHSRRTSCGAVAPVALAT